MKTILIIVSIAVVALLGGYTIGYHRGVHDTFAIFRPNYSVVEIRTSHITAINRAPDAVISNTNISK
jgi:hypothetical protein